MSPSLDLAIIIVSWNVRELLVDCLRSIQHSLAESPLRTAMWVVDNASQDGTAEMVRTTFPQVHLLANTDNLGFAGGNNQAIRLVLRDAPRYVLLLNPDTIVRGRALDELVAFMDATPDAGMTGARLVYGDDSFQHSAFCFPGLAQLLIDLFPVPARLHETRLNGRYPRNLYDPAGEPFAVDHPLGASILLRRPVLETVGLLDESYFMYCEEIDWAIRIRAAGWQIYCVPQAEIVHLGGQSAGQVRASSFVQLWRSRRLLYRKHRPAMQTWLAARLVRLAMRLRIRQTDSPELQEAYREVARIWK